MPIVWSTGRAYEAQPCRGEETQIARRLGSCNLHTPKHRSRVASSFAYPKAAEPRHSRRLRRLRHLSPRLLGSLSDLATDLAMAPRPTTTPRCGQCRRKKIKVRMDDAPDGSLGCPWTTDTPSSVTMRSRNADPARALSSNAPLLRASSYSSSRIRDTQQLRSKSSNGR